MQFKIRLKITTTLKKEILKLIGKNTMQLINRSYSTSCIRRGLGEDGDIKGERYGWISG